MTAAIDASFIQCASAPHLKFAFFDYGNMMWWAKEFAKWRRARDRALRLLPKARSPEEAKKHLEAALDAFFQVPYVAMCEINTARRAFDPRCKVWDNIDALHMVAVRAEFPRLVNLAALPPADPEPYHYTYKSGGMHNEYESLVGGHARVDIVCALHAQTLRRFKDLRPAGEHAAADALYATEVLPLVRGFVGADGRVLPATDAVRAYQRFLAQLEQRVPAPFTRYAQSAAGKARAKALFDADVQRTMAPIVGAYC